MGDDTCVVVLSGGVLNRDGLESPLDLLVRTAVDGLKKVVTLLGITIRFEESSVWYLRFVCIILIF